MDKKQIELREKIRIYAVLIVTFIAAFGVFCIAFPILVWRSDISITTILDFGQLFLSWPVSVLVLGLVLLFRFQEAIDDYLRNLKVKLPGGLEVQSQSRTSDSVAEPPGTITLSPGQLERVETAFRNLEQQHQLTVAQRRELEQAYIQANSVAREWKFHYLRFFYVPNTKSALIWFQANPGQTREGYNLIYQTTIPDESERDLIISVLIRYGSVVETNGQYFVTEEGLSFLQYFNLVG